MVTLGGITINAVEDTPSGETVKKRNPIAGSAKTNNIVIGRKNKMWTLTGFSKSEADIKAIDALVGQSNLTYVDKFGDSYTNCSINVFNYLRQNHSFYKYTVTIEQDE